MIPNILIILADDMGFADIGCYGSEINTPFIDSLSSNGIKYTQMYNSARCCPSRASLLTGLHPHQAGIGWMAETLDIHENYQGYLNDSCITIAELTKLKGYKTFLSGKWHVGNQYTPYDSDSWEPGKKGWPVPNQRGFDEFFGTLDGAGSYYNPHTLMLNDKFIYPTDQNFYYTEEIAKYACKFIDKFVLQKNPFFGYVSFTAPHWPLHARSNDISKFDNLYKKGWDYIRTARHEEQIHLGVVPEDWEISPRDSSSYDFKFCKYPEWESRRMATYAAQIYSMDKAIGQITKKLESLNIINDTLIMFMSDNGGCAEFLKEDTSTESWGRYNIPTVDGRKINIGNNPLIEPGSDDTFMSYDIAWANVSNTPFRLFKSWVHEGGISTPFLISWPNQIPKKEIRHCPIHFIDIMATIAEIIDIKYPDEYKNNKIHPIQGESFNSSFTNNYWTRTTPLWFEHEGNRALRIDDWKLVNRYGNEWELYNITDDRTEQNDFSKKEKKRLKQMIRKWDSKAKEINIISLDKKWNHISLNHVKDWKDFKEKFIST